jgi:hypothetical protein
MVFRSERNDSYNSHCYVFTLAIFPVSAFYPFGRLPIDDIATVATIPVRVSSALTFTALMSYPFVFHNNRNNLDLVINTDYVTTQ